MYNLPELERDGSHSWFLRRQMFVRAPRMISPMLQTWHAKNFEKCRKWGTIHQPNEPTRGREDRVSRAPLAILAWIPSANYLVVKFLKMNCCTFPYIFVRDLRQKLQFVGWSLFETRRKMLIYVRFRTFRQVIPIEDPIRYSILSIIIMHQLVK